MSPPTRSAPAANRGAETEPLGGGLDGADSTPRLCPVCCSRSGHSTAEIPYWLDASSTMPANWRFVHAFLVPLTDPGPSRAEKLDGARLYAGVYGDRALARAILEGRRARDRRELPHGMVWDAVWDRILAELGQAARA